MYMKEPGEREVVIFRGPEDLLEEPPTTAHVVMPSVAESAESPEPSVVSRVQSREYADIPESPHDMPLLSGDEGEGGEREPEKKKPIMACLFCRERKIACGPPPPGGPQRCK